MNLSQLKSVAIYIIGFALVVIGAIPDSGLPAGVHAALVVAGAVLASVERYLQGTTAIAKASK